MNRDAIDALLPTTLKRPDLIELLDALAKFGTKDQRSAAGALTGKSGSNAKRRGAIIDLALQARKRRKMHALSLGFAFCKVEAGEENPTLVDLLITPASASAETTCGKCRKLMGLDDIDAEAQAEEDAQVAEAEAETARRRKREERKAAKASATSTPETTRSARATGGGSDLQLDDGAGTKIEGAGLAIVYHYKGTDHAGLMKPTGEVLVIATGEAHRSPSAAAAAVTSSAVNGWARWRYTAIDGKVYPIDRLRGNAAKPVRVGVTGRRPTKASAVARLESAKAKAARLEARMAATRATLEALQTKAEAAAAEVLAAESRARELGAELPEPDLFLESDELDLEAEARLDDVQVRNAEARSINDVA